MKKIKSEPSSEIQKAIFQAMSIVASVAAFTAFLPVAATAISYPERFDKLTVYIVYSINIFSNIIWLTYSIGMKQTLLTVMSTLLLILSTTILIKVILFKGKGVKTTE